MPDYRLYHLRGAKFEVVSFQEFTADNDESAMLRSEAERGPNAMELWSGHRKVMHWHAPMETPGPNPVQTTRQ
jgi:hypothetical protein